MAQIVSDDEARRIEHDAFETIRNACIRLQQGEITVEQVGGIAVDAIANACAQR